MSVDTPSKDFNGRSVYERLVNVMLNFENSADLNETVHTDFVGYGSAAHEFFKTREDLKKMAQMQSDQLRDREFRYTRRPVTEKLFANGTSYLVLEEFDLFFAGNDHHLLLRLSSLLERIDGTWLVTHIHGSTPDSNIAEEEAFPEQGLRKKNEELEAKIRGRTRELEIETALERTRAHSLKMQHSSELEEVSKVFHEELHALGIDSAFSFVWLPNEGDGNHLFWATWAEPTETESEIHTRAITYPLDKSEPYTAACFTDWKSGIPVHEHFVQPEDIENFFASWKELLEGAEKLKPEFFPDGIYYTEAFMKYGCFGIDIRRPLSEEEKNILHRFAIEFERTYTRFLDLKKAEAQNRESQIELGLERVRARAMAMQKSEELSDLVDTVFKELTKLDFALNWCIINIIDAPGLCNTVWAANPDTQKTPESYHMLFEDYPFHDAMMQGYLNREPTYIYTIEGDEKKIYDEYLFRETEFRKVPQEAQMASRAMEKYVCSFSFSNFGGLQTVGDKPLSEESLGILSRFGKVFDLTYTRFNDLKRAEAQAREAQIEAALEKVRSRSISMQKTEDISDVAVVFLEQLKILKLNFVQAWINVFHLEEGYFDIWLSPLEGVYDEPTHLQFPSVLFEDTSIKSWKAGNRFSYVSFPSKEDVDALVQACDKATDTTYFSHFQQILELEQLEFVDANFKYGTVSKSGLEKATKEEEDILHRFAGVFEQTYTRFLDLQKAEAQAREARIETALEKVRSRTMAMQHSGELPEAANVLFLEIQALGIPAWSCGYNILAEDKKTATCWMSSEGTIQKSFPLRLYGEASFDEMGDFVHSDQEFLLQELGGKALEAHYAYMMSFPELGPVFKDIQEAGLSLPTYQINHLCKFQNGFLLFITYEPVPDAHNIFKRFTHVFEQTYTRFLDLKRAEAQTRASTIEAAIERVRARALAMQQPEELQEVAEVLRSEMGKLGVEELETSSIYIHDTDGHKAECWYALKDIREKEKVLVTDHITMDLRDTAIGRKMLKFYDSKKDRGSVVMKGKARKEWIAYCEERSEPLKGYYGENIPDRTYHLYRFSHGAIGAAAAGDLSEESWGLLRRAASVFSLAYSRFKDLTQARVDLQRLKEEKKRAEEALNELRLTQSQLIQAEKMASLGELTAGIAHEIQNPLNFVNNFSEVSTELIDEMNEEIGKEDYEEVKAIGADLKENLSKISHHGKRADSIVKGMLQHSRANSGEKEPTDINALADEYLRLAYHGLRAKDTTFNATLETDFDPKVGKIKVIPQDIGRVMLNLITNAFYAVQEKQNSDGKGYEPTVRIRTKKAGNSIQVEVADNGNGIPEAIKEKIFQPFFTTKPTGEGTGLGLSLSYDIVTKGHGGTLEVKSSKGTGSEFMITLNT